MEFDLLNEQFELLPQKGMYWTGEGALLLADLHLGKINHFRKSGIPVPHGANQRNIEVLVELVNLTRPRRIICLGDLFHSYYNPEWEVFGEVVKHFSSISFELVLGNHDIMSERQYERKGIRVYDELRIREFLLTHHPVAEIPDTAYNIAGHIHPGVQLIGKGRQSVVLPCFYFGSRQAYLPAFGMFTGLARIYPQKNDRVFVVAENKIMIVS